MSLHLLLSETHSLYLNIYTSKCFILRLIKFMLHNLTKYFHLFLTGQIVRYKCRTYVKQQGKL